MTNKRIFCILLCILLLLFSSAACSPELLKNMIERNREDSQDVDEPTDDEADSFTHDITVDENTYSEIDWAIYWYICGSDLESCYGSATADLEEMLQVELPENLTVVLQTGGAAEWKNSYVNPNYLERFVYNSNGLELVDRQPLESMGDSDTLSSFLDFAVSNYPAEHTAVIIWNHGGGSVAGAAFDELFDMDSLTLGEMYEAFTAVFDASSENPPIDLIGFDTCLMATIDTAFTFCDIAEYLVASQEIEPGNGWYYSQWLSELAENPDISGDVLGQYICDSYIYGCKKERTDAYVTLSVTDLGKIGPLLSAYDDMGAEALRYAYNDPTFFVEFSRNAMASENYGGNSEGEGYSNMVDLGHLARNNASILPNTADRVLEALEDCIVYKVNGTYRDKASGLSCYFSYNGDLYDLSGYQVVGASTAFKCLYSYGLTGELPEEGEEYLGDVIQGSNTTDFDIAMLEDWPLYVTNDGYAVLDIGAEMASMLRGVYFNLYYISYEEDLMLCLGRDNDIYADWENGTFYDNFRGVWGSIDGHLVYMELCYEDENYNLYAIPILLNGEEMNLYVVYSFVYEQFEILGARREISDGGMADKNYILLQQGDIITTVHYAATLSGDDDFMPVALEEIVVDSDTEFSEQWLGNGEFVMMYEMVDIRNNAAYSEIALFTIENGEIYTSVE